MKTKILKLFWHNKMQHINKDRIANSIRSMSWHTTSMDTSCRDIPLMTLAMVHSNTKVRWARAATVLYLPAASLLLNPGKVGHVHRSSQMTPKFQE